MNPHASHLRRGEGLGVSLALAALLVGCEGTIGTGDAGLDAHNGGDDARSQPDVPTSPIDTGRDQPDADGFDAVADAPQDARDAAVDSSRDALAVDAGRSFATDRALFGLGGASRCAGARVQLCEDFERGTLDTATWHVTGTSPRVETGRAARGRYALHIARTGNGASYISETRTFPAVRNTYYGRMFVSFERLPVATASFTYSHWSFAAASGTTIPGEIRLSGQLQRGRNLFGVGTDSRGYTGDWTTSDNDPAGAPRAVPTHEWLCIEWMHNGASDETSFYWDAVEHRSLHTTATQHGTGSGGVAGTPYTMPEFNKLWVGWQEYQTSTATYELWIDEVAVDSARIGCVL